MLRLYARGSKGLINFIAVCTITGGTRNVIAANSFTIFNTVVVTIGVYTSFYDCDTKRKLHRLRWESLYHRRVWRSRA